MPTILRLLMLIGFCTVLPAAAALQPALISGLAFQVDTANTSGSQSTPPDQSQAQPADQPASPDEGADRADQPPPVYQGPGNPSDQQGPRELSTAEMWWEMLGSLFVVLGVIVLLAFLARKYLPNQFRPGGHFDDPMRIVHTLPLGGRRQLHLVDIGGQRLVIGATEQRISLIKDFSEVGFEEAMQEAEVSDAKTVGELLGENP